MQTIIDSDDGTVRLYHTRLDRAGTPAFECGGRVALTALGVDAQGALIAVCPAGCDTVASVPLTGGADAQRLHAHVRLADPKYKASTLVEAIESVLRDVGERQGLPSLELALDGIAEASDALDPARQPTLSAIKVERDALTEKEVERQLMVVEDELARIVALEASLVAAAEPVDADEPIEP